MNRAERRRRTRNKQISRIKGWDCVYQQDNFLGVRHIGKARDRSPFDCGRTACYVCSRETGDHIGRQAAHRGSIDDEPMLDRLMSHE